MPKCGNRMQATANANIASASSGHSLHCHSHAPALSLYMFKLDTPVFGLKQYPRPSVFCHWHVFGLVSPYTNKKHPGLCSHFVAQSCSVISEFDSKRSSFSPSSHCPEDKAVPKDKAVDELNFNAIKHVHSHR